MKSTYIFFIAVIFSLSSMGQTNSFAKEESYPYLITFFDSTEYDYNIVGVMNANIKIEATNASLSECRSKDGTSALAKNFPIKKISGTPYSLSFNIVLKEVGGRCEFEFSGGSLLIVVQSQKTGEKKVLYAAIDRFFRNREGPVGSDVLLSASTNPNVMGSVLMESMRPVVRVLE